MMSAAILCTRQVLPSFFIPMALQSPTLFRLPLAPAEGLMLSMAGFHRNSNGQDISMASITQSSLREVLLMTDEEYEASQAFKQEAIYPQLIHDWFMKRPSEYAQDKNLLDEWKDYAARFTPSPTTWKQWEQLHQDALPNAEALQIKEQKEQIRVLKAINTFHFEVKAILAGKKKPLTDNQIAHVK